MNKTVTMLGKSIDVQISKRAAKSLEKRKKFCVWKWSCISAV